MFAALSGPGASIWSTGVPRVGGALATLLEGPLVLVLDDLHTIGNPSCLDVVAALCEYVSVRITDRDREQGDASSAPGPLADSKGGCRRSAWLTCDSTSRRRRRCCVARVSNSTRPVADPTERTEGWPAGLYLAALSLQAGAPGPARVETFTGEDRLVADYFRFELLSRLPEAEARFLMHTSVLDRMCGGLCDAVLQTRGSASILESLERSNRLWCHSTVGASGTATTTCSASHCETSSSVATPKQSRS